MAMQFIRIVIFGSILAIGLVVATANPRLMAYLPSTVKGWNLYEVKRMNLAIIVTAIEKYKAKQGSFPQSLLELNSFMNTDINARMEAEDADKWYDSYFRKKMEGHLGMWQFTDPFPVDLKEYVYIRDADGLHYTLHSSGLWPFAFDDMYATVDIDQQDKVGLRQP